MDTHLRVAELEGFQGRMATLRSHVPVVFALIAFVLTLALLYVGYTQVEVVRLFVRRWRALPAAVVEAPALPESTEPVEEAPEPPTEENKPQE
jgi:hypothetical protein